MDIHTNIPLKNFTTMRLGGNAKFMVEVRTEKDLISMCRDAKAKKIPFFIIGGGSNLIAHDNGYDGLIIRMRIPGFEVITDNPDSTIIKIGAGEDWDSVVKRSVDMNLSGIEAMSAIPGTAGAGPVQNVGAYGQEIADTMQSLTAYDTANDKIVTLSNSDCQFSYRNSIFRSTFMGRYIITSITLKLSKSNLVPPFYTSLQKYLDDMAITQYSPKIIRDAVIQVRKTKLPDPKIIASSGSFFKNVIIDNWQLNNLKEIDPTAPAFDMGEGRFKVPSGWLLENTGLKGEIFHGIRVYAQNAVVLVNESANSYSELAAAREEITVKVFDKFKIQLEQEPLEIT